MKLQSTSILTGLLLAGFMASPGMAQDDNDTGFEGRERGFNQGPRGPARGMPGRPGRMQAFMPGRQFMRLDSDEDGRISLDEFIDGSMTQASRLFDRLDRDEDGLIDLEQETRQQERPRQQRPARAPALDRDAIAACLAESGIEVPERPDRQSGLLAEADSNADGFVDLGELSTAHEQRAREVFARQDANGDGFIEREELQAQAAERRERQRSLRECVRESRTSSD